MNRLPIYLIPILIFLWLIYLIFLTPYLDHLLLRFKIRKVTKDVKSFKGELTAAEKHYHEFVKERQRYLAEAMKDLEEVKGPAPETNEPAPQTPGQNQP